MIDRKESLSRTVGIVDRKAQAFRNNEINEEDSYRLSNVLKRASEFYSTNCHCTKKIPTKF